MSNEALPAHTLAEAYLYLMVTSCPACGRGPLRGDDAKPELAGEWMQLVIASKCAECAHPATFRFQIPGDLPTLREQQRSGDAARINPTESPSRIIDAAQWIVLFRIIAEAAAKHREKPDARRLGYEAAQCLEEALKFYRADNDLPPAHALFHDSSREMFEKYPQEFSKERLLHLRSKLPTLEAMEAAQKGKRRSTKRRWWLPWR